MADNDGKTDETGKDLEANSPECDGGTLCDGDIPIPPDGGWGWVIVLSSFLCNLIVDGIAYTFGVFLPHLVIYFGVGPGTVSMVGSLLAGVYLSCGPIVGALTNKFGCRTTCIMGSVVGGLAFVASSFSNSVTMLMITYGVIGGIGFGLIYLPAIVSVGYYFEKKRAFATGIAVCGSGFGTFVFAPVANLLLENFDWKGANLILAGLIFNCAVFGALMRPLVAPKKQCKPLLQRMAEDKALQMERGSLMGSSYFMVQLPDGSYEKRLKVPVNVDPGVHSSFNLDELAQSGCPPTAGPLLYTAGPTLPTISEARTSEAVMECSSGSSSEAGVRDALESPAKEEKQLINSQLKETLEEGNQEEPKESDKLVEDRGCCSSMSGLMDFSLMLDPVFLFLGVSNIFGMLGFYVPFVFIIDAATETGIEPDTASFLLSIIGITNTVGRIISGWLSDFPSVDSLLVTNICIFVSGISLFCVPFCFNYATFCVAAGVFGLFSSAFIALTSIVLVDLLGIQQLTNAFGLLCLLRGVAAIAGPPLAGSLYEAFKSYDVPFWLAGVFLFISSAISFMVPLVRRYEQRRLSKKSGEQKELKELKKEDVPRVVQTQATPQTSPVKV